MAWWWEQALQVVSTAYSSSLSMATSQVLDSRCAIMPSYKRFNNHLQQVGHLCLWHPCTLPNEKQRRNAASSCAPRVHYICITLFPSRPQPGVVISAIQHRTASSAICITRRVVLQNGICINGSTSLVEQLSCSCNSARLHVTCKAMRLTTTHMYTQHTCISSNKKEPGIP